MLNFIYLISKPLITAYYRLQTYVRSNIPSKHLIEFEFPRDIQILVNLCGKKWLIMSIYKPPKQNAPYLLSKLNEALIFYSKYDYTIISGDFNLEATKPDLFEFLELNSCLLYTSPSPRDS